LLDNIIADADYSEKEFKKELDFLNNELILLQQKIKEEKLPVIIVFEGFSASGKGTAIAELIADLDPRFFNVKANSRKSDAENSMPSLWRYWMQIPSKGQIEILDRSWYQETAIAQMEDGLSKKDCENRYRSINIFERQLTDDGYLIIKFFLLIDEKEQQKRLETLKKNKLTSFRVTERDLKQNKYYEDYYKAFDKMLDNTDTEYSGWNIIPSFDKNSTKLKIFRTVVKKIKEKLSSEKVNANLKASDFSFESFGISPVKKLSEINLSKETEKEKYKSELDELQKELSDLQCRLFQEKIPAIFCFEGWDAAGKGGAIRRVSKALDPRGYDAKPISAPDELEKSKHYLWRFWREMPAKGYISIFDRTWYGRVLVERVEKLITDNRLNQAYQEINEFEKELYDNGCIILKFWVQINKDEQKKRFDDRQKNPEKKWKITDEDWRNREKWDDYEQAVDEMTERTSTDFAPWHVIEGNDKKYARIKVLKIIIKAIKGKLKDKEGK